jgi:hypothetical protein
MTPAIRTTPFLLAAAVFVSLAPHPLPAAGPFDVSSAESQVHLVELFSSEGCSGCPTAERWLADLRKSPTLWKTFVPVEFHVDYWNRLGWVDPFSKEKFTERQREYAASWGSSAVYTPGFALNGEEWRPQGEEKILARPGARVGVLRARRTAGGGYLVTFRPAPTAATASVTSWYVTGALLGNGLVSQVLGGENQGRRLAHEFVVLAFGTAKLERDASSPGSFAARLDLDPSGTARPAGFSAAFWVAPAGKLQPVQAVGGDVPEF